MNLDNIGILDPLGNNLNPLNNIEYSDDYKELAKTWTKLPGYENATGVIKDILDNQVLLISAETGSGKTVLVPKYVLHALNYDGKIGVTLPKQIVTKSSAEYAAKTLDVTLGEEVGYQYRGAPSGSKSSNTKLLYATDGTIVARLLNDPELREFDAIIVDEAHERKVQIDFLLYLLKRAAKLRPEFKIIIMSATINSEIFVRYFEELNFKQINISGRTNYPIESIFMDKSITYNESINIGTEVLKDIIKDDTSLDDGKAHDILFFVTSSRDAINLCKIINHNTEGLFDGIYCVEVYSGMDSKRQELAQHKDNFKELENGKYTRKLVIATNVAESSLTIDGIKYVIDSGFEFRSSYDPVKRAKLLDRLLITQAQAKQRMGRAGRTEPGICYHLYTSDDFNNQMEKYPKPDIRTSDLSGPSLKLLSLESINSVEKLISIYNEFIEPPYENYINAAIIELVQLGAITLDENVENAVTKMGQLMSKLNLDPIAAHVVIMGKIYNCSHELIDIFSLLDAIRNNLGSLLIDPRDMLKGKCNDRKKYEKNLKFLNGKFNKARNKVKHKYGDHLTLLNIYNQYRKIAETNDWQKINNWAYERFIKIDPIKKSKKYSNKMRNGIKRIIPHDLTAEDLDLNHIEEINSMELDDRILMCLLMGHRLNIANKKDRDFFKTKNSDEKTRIDRKSFLTLTKVLPSQIIYTELFISMGKSELNIASRVPTKLYDLL